MLVIRIAKPIIDRAANGIVKIPIEILYGYDESHQFIANQDSGPKNNTATRIGLIEAQVSMLVMLRTEPPITLRIPISFTRTSTR